MWKKMQINFTTYYIYGSKKKNKLKPSIIIIMPTRKNPANKFHHLVYLWQREKNKPKPSIIVIMATRKNPANEFHHLVYLW
jgi:hypothetical protein